MRGKLVILSGPSGVGKDTVLVAWTKANPKVVRVISYTTRPIRPGETDGIDYHFVDRDRFLELVGEGAFLEFKEVHGNLYATPLADMNALLEAGKIAVLKIDVQGAQTAMEKRPDALTIFLLPPSHEELEARIRGRATEDDEAIRVRLENARQELEVSRHYQHRLVNMDIDQTVAALEAIVTPVGSAP
jgi:guanylate kinase